MAITVTRIQNFIDGEPADATKGRTETMVNPATAAPLAEAPLSSAQDVDRGAGGRARRIRSSACISSWEGRRPLSSQRQRERVEGFLERRPSNADGKDLWMYSLEDYTHVKHVMANIS